MINPVKKSPSTNGCLKFAKATITLDTLIQSFETQKETQMPDPEKNNVTGRLRKTGYPAAEH